jgi:ubiquinone/menaquinone biosynthesis C-methylase UbiE
MSEIDADLWSKELESEREEHNVLYAARSRSPLDQLNWKSYYATHGPAHELGGEIYGLDVRMLMDMIDVELRAQPQGIRILDYACGSGDFSVILAQRGYEVRGFDISDTGVDVARGLARRYEVDDKAEFVAASADNLPYGDGEFDLVIGKAVLHHIIKYPGTAAELHRVMKPGGRAIFCEGAASNPLIRFARSFTIIEELGDVPLTIAATRKWTAAYSETKIEGHFFLYMLKTLGYSWNEDKYRVQNALGKSALFRFFLRASLLLDRLIVTGKPWSKYLGGRIFIHFVK